MRRRGVFSNGAGQSFSISFDDITIDLVVSLGFPTGSYQALTFNREFTKAYAVKNGNPSVVYQGDLSTANDLNSLSYSSKNFSVSGESRGVYISNDGLSVFYGMFNMRKLNLGTKDDITTSVDSGTTLDITPTAGISNGFNFSVDEQTVFTINNNNTDFDQFNLTTAKDLTTATHTKFKDYSAVSTTGQGVYLFDDGVNMLSVHNEGAMYYKSTIANDLDGFFYTGKVDGLGGAAATIADIWVNEPLQKLYILISDGKIKQYSYTLDS